MRWQMDGLISGGALKTGGGFLKNGILRYLFGFYLGGGGAIIIFSFFLKKC